ncbi:MAG TPA: hypothetical protein VFQ32_02035 [Ktedonobacterales bacterium]|nr:hypothetical protein [Ktedonobacterales bacterium]
MRTHPVTKRTAGLTLFAGLVTLLALLLTGCGTTTVGRVHDASSLMAKLRAEGANVQEAGVITHPFLAVPGRIITVNDQEVETFQYANAQALAADTANIGPDGCIGTVGGGMLDAWTAPPHLYKSEGLLVIYLGSDAKILQLLTGALGKQFAGA